MFVAAVTAVVAIAAIPHAKAIEPYVEYRKQVEKAESIDALKPDLMGEQVSLYDGSTRFEVTDISIPGNNSLPVQLVRSWSIELRVLSPGGGSSRDDSLGGIGNWTLEVPYIAGSFDAQFNWKGGYPGHGSDVSDSRCSKAIWPGTSQGFLLNDIWQGNAVTIPGQGSRVMLAVDADNPPPVGGSAQVWTTKDHDRFSCIPMKSGLTGEGFLMTDASGVKYYFDTAVSRTAAKINVPGNTTLRVRTYLLASRVQDRFGNYVDYTYDGNGQPVRIQSSDGRLISLSYSEGNLTSATANGRTWSYHYAGASGQTLASVDLPDGSRWLYEPVGSLTVGSPVDDSSSEPSCLGQELYADFGLNVTHPSGAKGRFSFSNTRHYRSGVPKSYCSSRTYNDSLQDQRLVYTLQAPYYWDVMSLYSKEITGAGLPGYTWSYSYDNGFQPLWSGNFSQGPCSTCVQEKTNRVTNPDGSKSLSRFGIVLAGNEARELGSSVLAADGKVMRTQSNLYLSDAEAVGQPFNPKWGNGPGSLFQNEAKVRPVVVREILQDGVTFRSAFNTGCVTAGKLCADALARPTMETESNSLGYARTNKTEYYDNTSVWVIGQVSKSWTNNVLVSETSYNASTALPVTIKSFGKIEQALTYNADGTVATVADGNGNKTSLSSWKRGTPQLIAYADGTTQSAVVDPNGWLQSVTDENGFVTAYTYDSLGRLASTTYPTGDSTAWHPTTYTFEYRNAAEHGLPAGHWLRRQNTGNHRRNTFLDALWRPVLVHEYDAADVEGTLVGTSTQYDSEGRVSFTSYPANNRVPPLQGVWTEYDALGRTTAVAQDSELGVLTTVTDYLPGFKTRTTDPNKGYTTTSYQVFATPTQEYPALIEQPEGVTTEINRDVFGKPLELTR
ncbi:hypothetical protein ABB29_04335 [Pseudoxanthomonas dokdonensis]|uniref:Type IV secretion protein Rhs n=1 Tax=Pseudoxanthomonas dokdonensis TaxID=344882 RepID=A0A0R0CMA2_9GAMM|nr:hypothetical protein ABB29_04335 [Pseudoxanthomonas dokdonensis]